MDISNKDLRIIQKALNFLIMKQSDKIEKDSRLPRNPTPQDINYARCRASIATMRHNEYQRVKEEIEEILERQKSDKS